jgi:hypothetical protein
MANYRLEIWFNYRNEKVDWGVALANPGGNPPFSNGGTPLSKNGNKVTLTGIPNDSVPFDIYLFDNTGDTVARQLQWFALDYEEASTPAPGQVGRDPISDAESLRTGQDGDTFMGLGAGGRNGNTSGQGSENNITCAPGTPLAERRWSADIGYGETLASPGNYQFTAAFVIGSPSEGSVKGFTVDPEMDIQT